jgi:hypothetical protein
MNKSKAFTLSIVSTIFAPLGWLCYLYTVKKKIDWITFISLIILPVLTYYISTLFREVYIFNRYSISLYLFLILSLIGNFILISGIYKDRLYVK